MRLVIPFAALTALAASTGCSSSGDSGGDGPVKTKLPTLPALENVVATARGDAVNVVFDPLDDARDYRIYPLPSDDDITVSANGSVVVKDAIYRCAGARQSLYMLEDMPDVNDNAAGGSTIQNGDVEGFERKESDAELGYVYTTPGPGRLPVYVLGDPAPGSDGGFRDCGRPIFNGTRPKVYTTDEAERDRLLAKHARNDGVAFYVPEKGSSKTRPVYEGTVGDNGDVLRWIDGPEGTQRNGSGKAIFDVLTAKEGGAAPLMRIHVSPYCATPHDELVAGMARYRTVRSQGDQPLTALRWAGLDRETTLVVEALDEGCPDRGHLSPGHVPAHEDSGIDYAAFMTLDDLRKASSTGEVFVNGQYEEENAPKAIARAFVQASPEERTAMDFFAGFEAGTELEAFEDQNDQMWVDKHFRSPTYDLTTYSNSIYEYGVMLGELWFTYADVGADVGGKIRLTPLKKARIDSSSFLHVTAEVDILSTDRRYPQILISDRDAPVQGKLTSGVTLIVQPKDYTPTYLQVQVCNKRTWDVNDQCPRLPTFLDTFEPSVLMPGELSGLDRTAQIDVYVSTKRIYLLLEGLPYSCTDLPAKGEDGKSYSTPSGDVTVTFGDVLYHSGADLSYAGAPLEGKTFQFHRDRLHTSTRRHLDNFGFQSGVAAPDWDEALTPCAK